MSGQNRARMHKNSPVRGHLLLGSGDPGNPRRNPDRTQGSKARSRNERAGPRAREARVQDTEPCFGRSAFASCSLEAVFTFTNSSRLKQEKQKPGR